MDHLALQHWAPHYGRFDNGPELVAHAVHDWCRFASTGSLFIDPGSPWQNAWIEALGYVPPAEYEAALTGTSHPASQPTPALATNQEQNLG